MKTARIALLSLMAFSALTYSCKDTETPPPVEELACGDPLQWNRTLDMDANLMVSKVENGYRIFQFEDVNEPVNICTDDIAAAKYEVDLKQAGSSADISFSAYAYWVTVKKTEAILFDATTDLYSTEMQLSLKDAFPDQPGYAGLQIHVKFPTKGSLDADKTYLKENVSFMRIGLDYNKYKEK
jgi:hypothetical protein